jgi:cell division protein FtsB
MEFGQNTKKRLDSLEQSLTKTTADNANLLKEVELLKKQIADIIAALAKL